LSPPEASAGCSLPFRRGAGESAEDALQLDPHFAPANQTLGSVYLYTGKRAETVEEFQKALQFSGTGDTDLMLIWVSIMRNRYRPLISANTLFEPGKGTLSRRRDSFPRADHK